MLEIMTLRPMAPFSRKFLSLTMRVGVTSCPLATQQHAALGAQLLSQNHHEGQQFIDVAGAPYRFVFVVPALQSLKDSRIESRVFPGQKLGGFILRTTLAHQFIKTQGCAQQVGSTRASFPTKRIRWFMTEFPLPVAGERKMWSPAPPCFQAKAGPDGV